MDSCNNDQAYYDFLLSRINTEGCFSRASNIQVTKVAKDYAEGVLHVVPTSLNPRGIVHGGCMATLADTVAGMACCTRGYACVTVNYMLNFLRTVSDSKTITCVAKAEKVGRTISVYACELTDDKGRVVASGSFTFFNTGECLLDQVK